MKLGLCVNGYGSFAKPFVGSIQPLLPQANLYFAHSRGLGQLDSKPGVVWPIEPTAQFPSAVPLAVPPIAIFVKCS